MYTIYLSVAIGLLIDLVAFSRNRLIWPAFYGVFFGAFFGLTIALFAGNFAPRHEVVDGPTELVAMHSSEGLSGTFVWGSGAVNSVTTYNFLYKNEDGSLTPGQVRADFLVHIIEDADLKGVGYWSEISNDYDHSWYGYNWVFHLNPAYVVEEQFRVPAGSVVQNINIK